MRITSLITDKKLAKHLLIGVGVFFLLFGGTKFIYSRITDVLVESHMATIKELAKKDALSVENSLHAKWKALEDIPHIIGPQTKWTARREFFLLGNIAESLQVRTVILVDSEGSLHSSAGTIKKNLTISEYCAAINGRFVLHFTEDDTDPLSDDNVDYFLLGVKLPDFQIGDYTYRYALCTIQPSWLEQTLKLDCYAGKGYSAILDRKGRYIAGASFNEALLDERNVFRSFPQSKIQGYASFYELGKEVIQKRKSITTTGSDKLGEEFLLYAMPLSCSSWYYITFVPLTVFASTSLQILHIVGTLLLILILIFAFSFQQKLAAYRKQKEQEEIYRKDLTLALSEAKQASRAKTIFLNSMSHDIRTPLNAIIGFTHLAQAHLSKPGEVSSNLDKIDSASQYLLTLINDILDMSRIESGKLKIIPAPEDLFVILQNTVSIVQNELSAKHFAFTLDAKGLKHSYVLCDKLRLQQVLLHLLANAIQFTPAGGTITAHLSEEEATRDNYGKYTICVKDTGIGMSEEFIGKVFEPFSREETSTISGIAGTGLGMSIVKSIVDMMGGAISCTSAKGKGTEFTIVVELEQVNAPARTVMPAEEACIASTNVDFTGKRILLVEDNKLNQEIASFLLTEVGISVEIADNGRSGVDTLVAKGPHYFDAVLMDIQMPVMNGYEATKAIRALPDEDLNSIPILALTANAFAEDKALSKAAGMNGHIAKPIDTEVLFLALKEIWS